MKKICKGLLLPLFLFLSAISWAQNKTITGKVVDENNAGVVGASVIVKNTIIGTITDANGDFTLSVPASAQTLVISIIGFVSQDVAITGDNLSIALTRSAGANLDE